MTTLDAKVGVWAEKRWILEIWRLGIPGDEALCFEFLDGDSCTLREEEDVPVLVAHYVSV